MIVKNESHILHEVLESTLPIIHTYCIVDTGSSDNTIQIIRDFYDKAGVHGIVHERPWVDFATNRTQALQLCDGAMDYALMMDADDLFVAPPEGRKQIEDTLAHNPVGVRVLLKSESGRIFHRVQIFRMNAGWHYVGVVHEYPECADESTTGVLPPECYIKSRRLGARNLDPKKYLRDAELLEKGLEKEPNNARYMFYLGQSYRDADVYDKAVEWYTRCIAADGWNEERYIAALNISRILDSKEWALKALEINPKRSESLVYYVMQRRKKNQITEEVFRLAERATTILKPTGTLLFVESDVYDWRCWDEYAFAAFALGKREICRRVWNDLLQNPHLPEEQKERVRYNRTLCSNDTETMDTYIINLPKETARKAHMEAQLSSTFLKPIFVNAISEETFHTMDFSVVKEFYDPYLKTTIRNGEVGCALSHWNAWNLFYESGAPICLILEDDVCVRKEKLHMLNEDIARLPANADIVYLERKALNASEESDFDDHFRSIRASYWLCSYLLTRAGAQKLLQTQFNKALLVVDEFIPILYDSNYKQMYAKYYNGVRLNAYACKESYIHLVDGAFQSSGTFHSNFYKTHAFAAITLRGSSRSAEQRWRQSCEKYGITPYVVDSVEAAKICVADLHIPTFYMAIHSHSFFIGNPHEYLDVAKPFIKDNLVFGHAAYVLDYLSASSAPADTSAVHGIVVLKNDDTFCKDLTGCVLQGDTQPLICNRYENYLLNKVYSSYGFKVSRQETPTARVLILIVNTKINHTACMEGVQRLEYPKDLLQCSVLQKFRDFNGDDELCHALQQRITSATQEFDYMLLLDASYVITEPSFLKQVIASKKHVVTGLFRKSRSLFANFWGDITPTGWYKRSEDYVDILDMNAKNIWNMPYIYGAILFSKEILQSKHIFGTGMDFDMYIAKALRDANEGMYMMNDTQYGTILDIEDIGAKSTPRVRLAIASTDDPIANLGAPLAGLWTEDTIMHPDFLQFIRTHQGSSSRMKHVMTHGIDSVHTFDAGIFKPIGSDIWMFPFFNPAFCDWLIDFSEKANKWSGGTTMDTAVVDTRINAVENIPTQDVHLFQLGFHSFWEHVTGTYLKMVMSYLYSYLAKAYHIAFVVKYSCEGQSELKAHHDSSVFTLNVALNGADQYTGGGVRFLTRGVFVKNERQGYALLHPGRVTHYHEALPITSGKRFVLVSFNN